MIKILKWLVDIKNEEKIDWPNLSKNMFTPLTKKEVKEYQKALEQVEKDELYQKRKGF